MARKSSPPKVAKKAAKRASKKAPAKKAARSKTAAKPGWGADSDLSHLPRMRLTPEATTVPKPEKHKGGRGKEYSDAEILECLALMAEGRTLLDICEEEGRPSRTAIWRWKERSEANRNTYARAREDQMHAFGEENIAIADDGRNDWVERQNKSGGTHIALNTEAVSRSALRIRTREWMMERVAPKDYSARSQVDLNVTTPVSKAIEAARKRAAAAIERAR